MSWLNRISDIAGKAEGFLNKFDQDTADVLRMAMERNYMNTTGIDSNFRKSEYFNGNASSLTFMDEKQRQHDKVTVTESPFRNFHKPATSSPNFPSSFDSFPSHNEKNLDTMEYRSNSSTGETKEETAYQIISNLKDNQIPMLSVQLQEARDALAVEDILLLEVEKNGTLQLDDRKSSMKSAGSDDLERIFKERIDSYVEREKAYSRCLKSALDGNRALQSEISELKFAATESEVTRRRLEEQFYMASNDFEKCKTEFDEYKEKAAKILLAKEKLLESLNKEDVGNIGESSPYRIQCGNNSDEIVEQMCEQLRKELECSNLMICNFEMAVQELEVRLKREQDISRVQMERFQEEIRQRTASVQYFKNEYERIQLEYNSLESELRRHEKSVERKLAEKDAELSKLIDLENQSRCYYKSDNESKISALSERLISKQMDIERLEAEKRALLLRLERAEGLQDMSSLLSIPPSLQSVARFVKIAQENEERDPIVYFWCLYYAVHKGMSIDGRTADAKEYLASLLTILEEVKKRYSNVDAISQETVGLAHLENMAVRLFVAADKMDRELIFNKNVAKLFYTAAHLIDVATMVDDSNESLISTGKYAKWKAAQIYNCLKSGTAPHSSYEGGPSSAKFQFPSSDMTVTSNPRNREDNLELNNRGQTFAPNSPQFPETENSLVSGESVDSRLTTRDYVEAQRLAKYAVSALTYEDAKTAIENMKMAIKLLTKNKEID